MIIENLEICNFGLFKGIHELKLATESRKKPVVLVGGRNGAGKTTLLDAIKLCLYGPFCQGLKMFEREYAEYLKKMMHRIQDGSLFKNQTYLELKFKLAQMGRINSYRIRRSWSLYNRNKVKEKLDIFLNGSIIRDIEVKYWQDFLKEIVPLEFTKLFFFDGEKIQSLADDDSRSSMLKESFEALLGLDLIKTLQSDLTILASKQKNSTDKGKTLEKINEIQEKIRNIKDLISQDIHRKAYYNTEIDRLRGVIERLETRLAQEGGRFAEELTKLKVKKATIKKQIESLKVDLRTQYSELLPFILVPQYCRRLKERLDIEEQIQSQNAAKKTMEDIVKDFETAISAENFWNDESVKINTDTNVNTQRIIDTLNSTIRNHIPIKSQKLYHQLSTSEYIKISTWLKLLEEEFLNDFYKNIDNFRHLANIEEALKRDIKRASDNELIDNLVKELDSLHEKLGATRQELQEIKKNLNNNKIRLEECNSEYKKLEDDILSKNKGEDRLILISKASKAFKQFSKEVIPKRIREFEEHLLESYRQLSPNGTRVTKVQMNEKDFSINFYNDLNQKITKSIFSAGEKQIYAVALLWALTKSSKRPLPLIIDTPMGRLDSLNRNALIHRFFPHASHQIIIFSTDTEIDYKLLDELQPYISNSYKISRVKHEGRSEIKEGYFDFNT